MMAMSASGSTDSGTCTATLWPTWVTQLDNGTSATTTITNLDVWQRWTIGTTASTTTTDYIWGRWAIGGLGSGSGVAFKPVAAPVLTEEQKAMIERDRAEAKARQEKWQAEEAEREKKRQEAEAKAKLLLEEHLNEGQKKEITKHGYFTVISQSSQRRYRIGTRHGSAGNIRELDGKGKEINQLCCHPRESLPVHDAFLTQMLWLMWCEDDFRKTANISKIAA